MKPVQRFRNKPNTFWAAVRSLSQEIGYSKRGGTFIIPDLKRMVKAYEKLDLPTKSLAVGDQPTKLAQELLDYFALRAELLLDCAEPNLMTAAEAKLEFGKLKQVIRPKCPLPMNKQKGEKKAEAYLTGMVNMLIEKHSGKSGFGCDFDPKKLTTFTKGGLPVRTLARRVDGAFPSTVNPVAVWELKEYYYTTTFGSRVAGGVYETLLYGLELHDVRSEGFTVRHYLIVDAKPTWWGKGKSYLCRMVDMLHMGHVDEVLFGREVLKEMPRIVKEWLKLARNR